MDVKQVEHQRQPDWYKTEQPTEVSNPKKKRPFGRFHKLLGDQNHLGILFTAFGKAKTKQSKTKDSQCGGLRNAAY